MSTPFNTTLGIKDTAQNVKDFISTNHDLFLSLWKPLIPYVFGLTVLDIIVTSFFMDDDSEFSLGGIIASYFMVALVISWHRVVIHGPDNFTAMNPFKPQKHELVFMGVGVLLGLMFFIFGVISGLLGALMGTYVLVPLLIVAMIGSFYIMYKLSFYFPAKAVNSAITFKQSFDLTKGYCWKMVLATLLAALKIILLMILYIVIASLVLGGLASFLSGPIAESILTILLVTPIVLYVQPMVTLIGVTVLSNYYQHALQHKPHSES